jgi:hypothetical protein
MSEVDALSIDGKEYPLDSLTDQQKHMLLQVQKLEEKANDMRFELEQIIVAKDSFSRSLITSIQNPAEPEANEEIAA